MKILAADIGGTNSRFGYFAVDEKGRLVRKAAAWLKTGDASSFPDLIRLLRASPFPLKPEDADIAVLAVAGPVEHATYSNPPLIPWDVDISDGERDFGFRRAFLINDFIAQAHACRTAIGEAAQPVLAGEGVAQATAAVIGAGTGLGKAALVPDGSGGFFVVPSEGGHADFPFVTMPEFRYAEFLHDELKGEPLSGNIVVSGRGLSLLHRFLTGEDRPPSEIGPALSGHSATLLWAARFYGRVCRNYSLEVLALGGLFIAGGVAAKVPALVMHPAFAEEFRHSATMGRLLAKIPVFLISDEESGLWGSAAYGLRQAALRRPSIT